MTAPAAWWLYGAVCALAGLFAGWRLREAWDNAGPAVTRLAHPEPVCLVRHDHKGRQLADFLRKACPDVSDADLAVMCRAAQGAALIADRRHGGHAARVLLCDLDGAVRELSSAARATEVPQ